MKKKMAIILSLMLAYSIGATAIAAPSPTLVQTQTPGTQIVIDGANANVIASANQAATAAPINGGSSAVAPGTTFVADGQQVDSAAVALIVSPVNATQAAASVQALSAAFASQKTQIINFTGRTDLSLTDAQNRIRVLSNVVVSLQTADGRKVSQNGSISVTRRLADILGGVKLAEGETIQALYQRADGTWVAVPVVVSNGVVAFALPSFSGAVNVVFTVATGKNAAQLATVTSPRT
ncbi:MAG: hypothetical protein ACLR9I_05625 [Eisenbergiella sp.]